MLKITYLLPNGTVDLERYYSQIASERYRILNPAKELAKHDTSINFLVDPGPGSSDLNGTVIFVGKVFKDQSAWCNTIIHAKRRGAKFVQDVCDFHQLDDQSLYQTLIGLADRLTASSMYLKQALEAKYPDKSVYYIPDAPELPRGSARSTPVKDIPHLLWYGQEANLKELIKIPLPKCTLQLITNTDKKISSPRINICQTPWSIEAVSRALEACDFVVVPVDTQTPDGLAKSGNRVLEALWAGRPVIASRIPEYEHMKEKFKFSGLQFMDDREITADHLEATNIIERDQDQIEQHLTMSHTVKMWQEAFTF